MVDDITDLAIAELLALSDKKSRELPSRLVKRLPEISIDEGIVHRATGTARIRIHSFDEVPDVSLVRT
jgi:hypothetical protein